MMFLFCVVSIAAITDYIIHITNFRVRQFRVCVCACRSDENCVLRLIRPLKTQLVHSQRPQREVVILDN